jgi:chromosome segregation ATPase
MEPNNQSQSSDKINGAAAFTPPALPTVSAFDLSAALSASGETQVVTPAPIPPLMNIPIIAPPPVVMPKVSLTEQITLLEKDIVLLDQKRASLEVETGTLTSEQKQIEESLAPIVKEEEGLRAVLKEIEVRETSAKTKADRRKAEQERWEQEQKRRIVEVQKLEIKEKIQKILDSIAGKETLHQSIIDEETVIKKKIHELETEQKRIELNAKLQLITEKRGSAETKLAEITSEKTRIESLLRETQDKEKMIEGSEHETEQKMTAAKTFKEERAFAEERAVLEKERHEIEEARWRAEDEAEALGLSEDEAEKSLQDIKKQEAELIAKIKAFK